MTDRRQVYFIGSVGGPIKIGVSDDPYRRLMALQTGCPHRLSVLASVNGDESHERYLHQKFKRWNIGGEWFAPNPELLAIIWQAASHDGISLPSRDFDFEMTELQPLVLQGYPAVRMLVAKAGITGEQAHNLAWLMYQAAFLRYIVNENFAVLPPAFPSDFVNLVVGWLVDGQPISPTRALAVSHEMFWAMHDRKKQADFRRAEETRR